MSNLCSMFLAKSNVTENDKIVCDRCSVNQIIELARCPFFVNNILFLHLKLEIEFEIPVFNE